MREKSEVNWGSLLVSKYSLEQRYIFLCRGGRDTDSNNNNKGDTAPVQHKSFLGLDIEILSL
jgi:hypothetical protein